MKKLITAPLIFLCLSLYHIPASYAQDTKKEQPAVKDREDADNEDDFPADEASIKQKDRKPSQKIHFGIEAGVNLAGQYWKSYQVSYTGKILVGGRGGVLIDIPLSKKIYVQPGIFYVMDGSKWNANSGSDGISSATFHFNTLELPLIVLYKTGHPGGNRAFFGGGPYMGYIINGAIRKNEPAAPDVNLKFGSSIANDQYAALDYGISANAGYEMTCGLYIKARYELGFSNLVIDPAPGSSIRDYNYSAQIGYLFGKHPKHKRIKKQADNDIDVQM